MPVFHNENAQTKFVSTYSIDNSLRFDQGSSSYMSWVPSSAGNEKTFTFSCWIKFGNDFGTHRNLWNYADNVVGDPRGQISITDENRLYVGSNPTGSTWHEAISKFLFKDPTAWYHICVAYDTTSGTSAYRTRVYINGEEIDHSTGFNSTSSFPISQNSNTGFNYTYQHVIGVYEAGNTGFFDGLLSDVYIVDGTQLAPSDFTETNEEGQLIPKEYTGSLGTNGGHYLFNDTAGSQVFADSSSSAHAITTNGNTTHTKAQKKVGSSSIYFDGSGDYITTPTTTFDMDGDFTIEAWVYTTSAVPSASTRGILNMGPDTWPVNGGWNLYCTHTPNNAIVFDWYNSSNQNAISLTSSTQLSLNTWYHVAVVRSGSTVQIYIDGSADGSSTSNSEDLGVTHKFQVGAHWNDRSTWQWEGYIDEVRVSNSARYTSGFTPSTDAFESDSNTLLLIHSDGTKHGLITNGNTTHTKAQKKIGSSSIYFDGSGDYLSVPASSDFDFGTSDFTVEFWLKPTSATAWDALVSSPNYYTSGYDGNWVIDMYDGYARIFSYDGQDSSVSLTSTTALSTGWQHVAFVRSSGTMMCFIDGAASGSTNDFSSRALSDASNGPLIGYTAPNAGPTDLDAYLDEFRISDSARYTSNFGSDLPTAAFESDSNTLLLIHSDWGGGLGGDSSTNGNDFSVVNMNDHDQMIDSPSPGKNFATLNPVAITNTGQTLSEGNLKHVRSGNWLLSHSTMAMTSGKWYAEMCVPDYTGAGFGIIKTEGNQVQNANTGNSGYVGKYSDGWGWWFNGSAGSNAGKKIHNGSDSSYGSEPSVNSILMVAFNADTGVIWFGLDGTWFGSATSAEIAAGTTTNATYTGISTSDEYYFASGIENATVIWNFGQDGTCAGVHTGTLVTGGGGEWAYAPPEGFGALKTDNLPEPAHNNAKTKAFSTTTYTGTSSSNSITTGHEVDLAWVKRRSTSNHSHVTDSLRPTLTNATSGTWAAWVDGQIELDSNGYTVDGGGAAANASGSTYVGWSWKAGGTAVSNTSGNITSSVSANTSAGFSIAKYTGVAYDANSGNHTVGHGLGVAPEMVIIKSLGDAGGYQETDWVVWHKDCYETTGYLILNSDVGEQGPDSDFYRTAPTSTVVNIGTYMEVSDNNDGSTWDDYIMYSFVSKDGHCKVGSYTGNGSTDGPMIHTGFKVGWIMIKSLDQEEWHIMDSKRDTINPNTAILRADEATAEGNFGGGMDFLANGVKLRESGGAVNNSDYVYIYLALSDNPFKYAIAR